MGLEVDQFPELVESTVIIGAVLPDMCEELWLEGEVIVAGGAVMPRWG